MARQRKVKLPKTLWDKVKEVDEAFATEIYALSNDALKEKLVTLAKADEEIEKAREKDPDIGPAKEHLKQLNETYSSPLKANKLKRKLVIQTLGERGQG